MAARQRGVVALWQLRRLGLTDAMVQTRVERGLLYRVYRGVLSVTPSPPPAARMLAAALTYGPDAVLSHRAAAAVWDLGPWPTRFFDVTVPRERKPQPGVRLHRATVERVVRDGFPVTTVTRTLVDLGAVVPLGRLRDTFERAERLRLLHARRVSEEIAGRRGARKVRAILAEWSEPEPTKNEFEQALRRLCREYDVPLPSQNVVLLGYEVDAFWPKDGLVVELDGWEFHKTRRAFEEDRRKAAALEAAGYRVLRFTWKQVTHEPSPVAAAIRSEIGRIPQPESVARSA